MPEWMSNLGDTIIWVAGLLAAATLISAPIFKLNVNVKKSNAIAMETCECQYMLMRDTIRWRHDYWIAHGYCPQIEKENTSEMYEKYRGKDNFGQYVRNGLTFNYLNEMLTLPKDPPCGRVARDTLTEKN